MRAARSVPAVSLSALPDAAADLPARLAALPARGRCGEAATSLLGDHVDKGARVEAGAHRALAPSRVRAGVDVGVCDLVSGSAAWALRGPGASGGTRSAAAACAKNRRYAWAVAADPHSPQAVVSRMANNYQKSSDLEEGLRWGYVQARSNPNCSAAVLAGAAVSTVSAAAAHPRLPVGVLRRLLAAGPSPRNRLAAQNPNCPPEALEMLATDPGAAYYVATNPDCPPMLFNELSLSDTPLVRSGCVENHRCPPRLLDEMAASIDWEEREQAAGHLNCPLAALAELASDQDADVRAAAAGNRRCTKDDLRRLAGDDMWQARAGAASNPKLDTDTQVILASDDRFDVRDALATNARCDRRVLVTLAADDDPRVRSVAARALRGSPPLKPAGTFDRSPDWRRALHLLA